MANSTLHSTFLNYLIYRNCPSVFLLSIDRLCGLSGIGSMAKAKVTSAGSRTPASTPATKIAPSSSQQSKNQKSILGFFQAKTPGSASQSLPTPSPAPSTLGKKTGGSSRSSQSLTPVPSSDGPEEGDEVASSPLGVHAGLPSPIDSANGDANRQNSGSESKVTAQGTPTRKVDTLP